MRKADFEFHVEGDLPGPGRAALNYVNPDPDGDGVAYNGKPAFTAEQAAEQLNRDGDIWVAKKGVITFSFLDAATATGQYNSPKSGLQPYVEGYAPFTAEQREAAREAIALWDDLIAVSFQEKNGHGGADIVYMNTNTGPAQAAAYTPFYQGGHGKYQKIQGDTFINQDQGDNFDLFYGGYGQSTLVHETGHAIGLLHPGDYNFSDDNDGDGEPDPITYGGDAQYFQDSMQYTIMSYFSAEETGAYSVNWNTGYYQSPQTPMLHDIAAVQAMYGADMTTRTGDTVYGFNSTADRDVFDFTINTSPFLTIWDAGGHDTLDLSGFSRGAVLDLNEGGFSSGHNAYARPAAELNAMYGVNFDQAFWDSYIATYTLTDNIAIAYGAVIEDGRTGAGNDVLKGNAVANRLESGAGNDLIQAGAGDDSLIGGLGRDQLYGQGGADRFIFSALADSTVIAPDRIYDFNAAEGDLIDLSAIDADTGQGGNQGFTWASAFTGQAGQAVLSYDAATNLSLLQLDVNGDGAADFGLHLVGVHDTASGWLL